MAEGREYRVRFATRVVMFESDAFRNRRDLAAAVQRGAVIKVIERRPGGRKQDVYLNLGLVEAVL